MNSSDNFLMRQAELAEAVGLELLKVTPERWKNIKGKITYVPVDSENYQLEFEITSVEEHPDAAQMSQALFDSAVELYRFCADHNQAWKEAVIHIYIDKKDDQWKCQTKYKYE